MLFSKILKPSVFRSCIGNCYRSRFTFSNVHSYSKISTNFMSELDILEPTEYNEKNPELCLQPSMPPYCPLCCKFTLTPGCQVAYFSDICPIYRTKKCINNNISKKHNAVSKTFR